MFSQQTLDFLISTGDSPRVHLYKARWGLPVTPGIPEWFAKKGTENHKAEYLAGTLFSQPISDWRNEVDNFLDSILLQHNFDEQCSGIYDTYYLAAACVIDHAAKRDNIPEIRRKCREYFQLTTNLWSMFRDSRGRVVLPGKRTTPSGHDERRDQCLKFLKGEIPFRWSSKKWALQNYMETDLVRQWAEVENWNFKPSDALPQLMDPIEKYEFRKGFLAISPVLTRCYGFPCWAAWSINNEMGSISWRDITSNAQRAKAMGWNKPSLNLRISLQSDDIVGEFEDRRLEPKRLPDPIQHSNKVL